MAEKRHLHDSTVPHLCPGHERQPKQALLWLLFLTISWLLPACGMGPHIKTMVSSGQHASVLCLA